MMIHVPRKAEEIFDKVSQIIGEGLPIITMVAFFVMAVFFAFREEDTHHALLCLIVALLSGIELRLIMIQRRLNDD